MSSVERIYLYIKYGKNGSLNYTYLRERRYIMQFQILNSARQLRYPRKKPKQNLADGETDPHTTSVLLRPAPSLGWAEEAREDLQRSSGSHTGIEPRAG